MSKPSSSSPQFREDINGLRAWAVTAVVLFHFGIPGFGGGFIGVDVFFVISGFLMTGILTRSLENNTFSLVDFFMARVRRIVPALLAVAVVLLVLGWVLLLPSDFKALAAQVVFSLAFLSNIKFWQEAGYFDAASHEKWLLHTWSLSLEWQFYLALPLLIWAVWAFRPRRVTVFWSLFVCMAISLAASIHFTRTDPGAAFYLLPMRAWELLAGGLVWLVPARLVPTAWRHSLQLLGLALIALSIVLFDKSSMWPGWNAIVPVAGTAMVLLADRRTLFVASAPAQWLGDRSYSIYLWHWPIAVLCQYLEMATLAWATFAALLLTLGLGHLSYHLVENPSIRFSRTLGRSRLVTAHVAAVLAVVVPALLIWQARGVVGRFSPAHETLADATEDYDRRQRACHLMQGEATGACVHGHGVTQAVMLGDSHAAALMPALSAAGAGAAVRQWTYSACPFVPGMRKTPEEQARRSDDYKCEAFIEWARVELQKLPTGVPVVLVGRYASVAMGMNEEVLTDTKPSVYFSRWHRTATPEYLREFADHITRSACELAQHRPVYMVRPIPEIGVDVPRVAARRGSVGRDTAVSIGMDEYLARNAWVIAAQDAARARCGVKIIDPLTLLCTEGRCYGARNNIALYHDDDHLSRKGSALIAKLFEPVFAARMAGAATVAPQ